MHDFKITKRIPHISIFFLLFYVGCASTGSNRSGALSEVMEKASDEYEGEREVETNFDPEESAIYDYLEEDSLLQHTTTFLNLFRAHRSFGLKGEYHFQNDQILSNVSQMSFSAGDVLIGENRLQLTFGLGTSRVKPSSQYYRSLKDDLLFLSVGLDLKTYLFKKLFFGQYVLLGAKQTFMFWRYRNSVFVNIYDDNGNVTGKETMYSDSIGGVDVYLGLGFHLYSFRNVAIDFEFSPGTMIWSTETHKGFTNDVFNDIFYLKYNIVFNWSHDRIDNR